MGGPILLVQLVRKFVNHDVATVVRHGSPLQRVLPGQDHLALRPGFTGQRLTETASLASRIDAKGAFKPGSTLEVVKKIPPTRISARVAPELPLHQ